MLFLIKYGGYEVCHICYNAPNFTLYVKKGCYYTL
jgi:hypothetical protein